MSREPFSIVVRQSELTIPPRHTLPTVGDPQDPIVKAHPTEFRHLQVPGREREADEYGYRGSSQERYDLRRLMVERIGARVDGAMDLMRTVLRVENAATEVIRDELSRVLERLTRTMADRNPLVLSVISELERKPRNAAQDAYLRIICEDAEVKFFASAQRFVTEALSAHAEVNQLRAQPDRLSDFLTNLKINPAKVTELSWDSFGVVVYLNKNDLPPKLQGCLGLHYLGDRVSIVQTDQKIENREIFTRHERNHGLLHMVKDAFGRHVIKIGSPVEALTNAVEGTVDYFEEGSVYSWKDHLQLMQLFGQNDPRAFADQLHQELAAHWHENIKSVFVPGQIATKKGMLLRLSTASEELGKLFLFQDQLGEWQQRFYAAAGLSEQESAGVNVEKRQIDEFIQSLRTAAEKTVTLIADACLNVGRASYIAAALKGDASDWVKAATLVLPPSQWKHIPRAMVSRWPEGGAANHMYGSVLRDARRDGKLG